MCSQPTKKRVYPSLWQGTNTPRRPAIQAFCFLAVIRIFRQSQKAVLCFYYTKILKTLSRKTCREVVSSFCREATYETAPNIFVHSNYSARVKSRMAKIPSSRHSLTVSFILASIDILSHFTTNASERHIKINTGNRTLTKIRSPASIRSYR